METLTRLIYEGHQVDVLYLDFRKAFGVVPKQRLLVKMESMGVRGKVLDWVKEWLTGRTQRVVLNGKQSGVGEVRSGVVQGSTLGPTLFLIYINEISSALKDGVSALDMTSSILSEWSRTWQLHFNTSKCKVMHLGKKNVKEVYTMEGTLLESTSAEKDIGVMIQESLKPSLHCAKTAAKANGVLGQLSRAVLYRDSLVYS